MGKVATAATAEMKPKKKGRPPKNRIPPPTPPKPVILDSPPITYSRSHRRNPKYFKCQSPEVEDDDDDDERTEKKVKLVVRLPQSDENATTDQNPQQKRKATHSRDRDSTSESGSESPETDSGSEPESEDRDARLKKRKINAADRGSDGAGSTQEKKVAKATDARKHGLPLESGPTTPLPDKKLLVFILDRLQKKDTYGVFSEPVDADELPDYFDVVEHPMDFGTVRKKLNRGAYTKLEELEADVFLICSNAMLYNAADTVYHRQAQTIRDLAKRDFENLRHEGDNGEPQPKVVRRGRPPNSKNQKKPLETSPSDRVAADPSSTATPTTAEDKATGSNSYNLRKGPALCRYRSNDLYVSPYRSRNGENYSELSGDWNNEFPASILRADMKYGKKQFTVDENRRDTYTQLHPHSSANNSSVLTNSMGDMKRLVTVGLHEPLAYARSLARFAANLGPTAWKVASKKIEYALPPGTPYGPGWVAETSEPHCFSEEMVEAVRKLNTRNEQNHMYHRNGFASRLAMPTEGLHLQEEARLQEVQLPQREAEMWTFGKSSWPAVPPQHSRSLAAPPDLNVRVPAASPSSPHRHPDLALQL